jgi:hypothetical protein
MQEWVRCGNNNNLKGMKKSFVFILVFLVACAAGSSGQKVIATKKDSVEKYKASDRLRTAGPKDGWKQENNSNIKNNFNGDTASTDEKLLKTKRFEAKYKGFVFSYIEPYFDSAYYPKSLYFNIRIAEINGLSIEQVNKGVFSAEIVSEKNEPVPMVKQMKQYVAKTKKEGEQINILASIPLNPQDKNNKKYTVIYNWKDAANSKHIQIRCKIGN